MIKDLQLSEVEAKVLEAISSEPFQNAKQLQAKTGLKFHHIYSSLKALEHLCLIEPSLDNSTPDGKAWVHLEEEEVVIKIKQGKGARFKEIITETGSRVIKFS